MSKEHVYLAIMIIIVFVGITTITVEDALLRYNQNEIDKIKITKELCRKHIVPEFVITDVDSRIRELKIKRRSIFWIVPKEIDTIQYLSHEHLRISNE